MADSAVVLAGCRPEPLAHYLKTLAVFRLVAEQRDDAAKGSWSPEGFVLDTRLTKSEIMGFFLAEYQPTPVLSPWNSGSGFWSGKTATATLNKVSQSTATRLEAYREATNAARGILAEAGLTDKPTKADKPRLLRIMRSRMPDAFVGWIDALCAITGDDVAFAPLLGTGGNDGNLEFSVNFMQRLADVMPFEADGWPTKLPAGRRRQGDPAEGSRAWLEAALFGTGSPSLLEAAVGQFHPGGVGGPNATQGFEGQFIVNPWDYVLMIEGALLLAGSVARRAGADTRQAAAFPFTVRPSPAGWHTIAPADAASARQEVWLPLWEAPASLPEVAHLLSEGRAQVGRRPAANGTDFARAVSSLGVDRGLSGFMRFGFVRRSGLAYMAAPLGHMAVSARHDIELIEEADAWLTRVRRAANRDTAPASLKRAQRAIDDAIFDFCQDGRPRSLQEVLMAMAAAELSISRSSSGRDSFEPLSVLSLRWQRACDDGTAEYRLALSLASMHCVFGGESALPAVGPLRVHLEPVAVNPQGRFSWDAGSTALVWSRGTLEQRLVAILKRRCLEAERTGALPPAPIGAHNRAGVQDIQAFIDGEVDFDRLGRLVEGLSLLRWPLRAAEPRSGRSGRRRVTHVSRLYALCKLLFHDGPLPLASAPEQAVLVRPEMVLLSRLSAGDPRSAVQIAGRRLRSSGFVLLGTRGRRASSGVPDLVCPPGMGLRIAAALLFPIIDADVGSLADLVIAKPEDALR